MNKIALFSIIFFTTIIVALIAILIFGKTECTASNCNQITSAASTTTANFVHISSTEFNSKIKTDEYDIIDIRTLEEYQLGHIENSTMIDFYSSNFKTEISKLDKNKKYLIYCNSGNRTTTALNNFKELGFSEVFALQGGITVWKANNLPITK